MSKYNVLPAPGNSAGSRGFRILAELAKQGYRAVMVTSDANHVVAGVAVDHEEPHPVEIEGVTVVTVRTFKVTQGAVVAQGGQLAGLQWRLSRMPMGTRLDLTR